jgi:regulator of replication initiation timing
MITPILVVATICATGAAVIFAAKVKTHSKEINDLETTYDKLVNKYADSLVENHGLKAELAKLKRKPRKDKGQPRKTYGGKPITRKRKVQKGE